LSLRLSDKRCMTYSILRQHLINSSLTRCKRFVHRSLKYGTVKPQRQINRSQAISIVERKKRTPERARNSPAAGKYDVRMAHSTQRRASRASCFHAWGDLRAHSRAQLFLKGRRRMLVVSNRQVVKGAESRKAWLQKTKNTVNWSLHAAERRQKLASCRSEQSTNCLSLAAPCWIKDDTIDSYWTISLCWYFPLCRNPWKLGYWKTSAINLQENVFFFLHSVSSGLKAEM